MALKGKTCSRLLKPQKVAPNAKSCSKVAERNLDRPIRVSVYIHHYSPPHRGIVVYCHAIEENVAAKNDKIIGFEELAANLHMLDHIKIIGISSHFRDPRLH